MFMYTMWTHLNGRKITVALLLISKTFRLPGIFNSDLLLCREEGKMFTNLTEPEKSQSTKGKGTSVGWGYYNRRKGEITEEEEREKGGGRRQW